MIKIHGTVSQGKLIIDRSDLQRQLSVMKDQSVLLTIKRSGNESDRSIQENRYYWGVVVNAICEATGTDPDDVHEALKAKFLQIGEIAPGLPAVSSTSNLNVSEFEQYLSDIRQWASVFLHIYIPLPNEPQELQL